MIPEIARIDVKAGMEAAFEAGVAEAAVLPHRALARFRPQTLACGALALLAAGTWDCVEAHTEGSTARGRSASGALVGHCFAADLQLAHDRTILSA